MSPTDPHRSETLTELPQLPLFPLGTVLFPGGLLPLQVFEVRYLDMVQRCHAEGTPFGVVTLRSGHEVRRAPRPGEAAIPADTFHPIGTLARITALQRPQPGLILIECEGTQRFSLQSSEQLKHGLWTGRAQLLPADQPAALPPELAHLSTRLHAVLQALPAAEAEAAELPAPLDSPLWGDAGWVANRWAELLPLDSATRHRLMALDTPLWRLELVAEWLERLSRQAESGANRP